MILPIQSLGKGYGLSKAELAADGGVVKLLGLVPLISGQ